VLWLIACNKYGNIGPAEGQPTEIKANHVEVEQNQDSKVIMEVLFTKATTPLYEGSSTNMLVAMLLLS
jgi:hypothetical protein